MTREQIIELQKVHSRIYKEEIEPIYKKAQMKEGELISEFKNALELYFDTIFKDKNGKTINKGDKLQLIEYQIKGVIDGMPFESWHPGSNIIRFRKMILNKFEETGKTRTVEFVCTERSVQFLFGKMLSNEKIRASKVKNGKLLKIEETFNAQDCSELEIISTT